MNKLQKYLPHVYAIIGFIIIALIYFYPVLQGKQIFQSDIAQYTGMAKEQIDFRKEYNEEPYWTNSAFGGLPTYQLGAKYPHNYIKEIDGLLRFLPRPADYLFLYFIGFYVLMLAFNIKPLKAFFGALAFGLSTYLIIILGVGHNAKAHAIAYIPLVLAGLMFIFQKRYIIGAMLTMVATALEIQANHFQMTYYYFYMFLIIGGYFIYDTIKNKDIKHLTRSSLLIVFAIIIALGVNATGLLATSEYAKNSTRSNSELKLDVNGKIKKDNNAMSYEYITDYSYGITESLNLIAPKLFGGSNSEDLDSNSELYNYAVSNGVPEDQALEIIKKAPTYWGVQPIVAAPAYIGVVVFFLAILALFISDNKYKYAILATAVLSLLLSWGKNFAPLTDFFINYVPMYNKFRAVSSIQVILELCFPILAIIGLDAFFKESDEVKRKKGLLISGAITGGTLFLLFVFKGFFDYKSASDPMYAQMYGLPEVDFYNIFIEDRKAMYVATLLRSLGFFGVVFVVMFFTLKKTIQKSTAIVIVGLVMVMDLWFLDKQYVKADDFVSKSKIEKPFEPTEADLLIKQDTSHYRVFEVAGNLNSARASYFHQSLGGYFAAKPKKYQELFDYQIAKNNMEVLNMLNTKYVIQQGEDGKSVAVLNRAANGNAWFVSKVRVVNNADEEMKALSSLKTKDEATCLKSELTKERNNFEVGKDSTSIIKLTSYKSNHLIYESNNSKNGFGVFSEMYYKNGWKAIVDGKETDIYNVNYVLRGLNIPAGKHKIEFKFKPQVVKTGSTISLISFIIMLGAIGYGIFLWRKNNTLIQK